MLSQIRQISDGNFNTVFVKNKEQKFNLDKEIHDLECWKQSRNHVYRKEEKELLTHLDKLKQQQEYLHHLDEERGGRVRGSHSSSQRGHSIMGSTASAQHACDLSPPQRGSSQELDSHSTPVPSQRSNPPANTPSGTLPPVQSFTDKRTLHRTEAHTNICLVCQLPRWSHSHQPPGKGMCSCDDQEGTRSLTRRFTATGHEELSGRQIPPPIQVGQRSHSLMMARLNESQYEYKPHPPERGHTGKSHQHSPDHVHIHRHVHNHVHMHHGHAHYNHRGHAHQGVHVNNHVNNHVDNHSGSMHGTHDSHVIDRSGLYGYAQHSGHNHHTHGHNEHRASAHVSDHHRHHHSSHDTSHTPRNSPGRYSHQSLYHYDPQISSHEPFYPTTPHHHNAHHYHPQRRRLSTSGSMGTSVQELSGDTRTRDHELHWDRHQVCKLKGMITDPHYKEQLEDESGRTYPWSGLYPPNKPRTEDIEDLKKCRYLRFSKLNLMSMKENPEQEVDVFEKESHAH